MRVRHTDSGLERIESDPTFPGSHGHDIVKAFRSRMGFIRNASDERDIRAMRSLHLEKLKGDRAHQHSIRLNKTWRLIIEFAGTAPNKTCVIVGIEDYH